MRHGSASVSMLSDDAVQAMEYDSGYIRRVCAVRVIMTEIEADRLSSTLRVMRSTGGCMEH